MTFTFTHTQRLNLFGLIGMQPAVVGELRAAWALQDKLDLTPEEGLALGLVRGDVLRWDPTKSIPPVEIELTDREVKFIRSALSKATLQPATRTWIEPLIVAFLEA